MTSTSSSCDSTGATLSTRLTRHQRVATSIFQASARRIVLILPSVIHSNKYRFPPKKAPNIYENVPKTAKCYICESFWYILYIYVLHNLILLHQKSELNNKFRQFDAETASFWNKSNYAYQPIMRLIALCIMNYKL